MAEITLGTSQSQRQGPEKPSRLEIEWNEDAQHFRVKVGTVYYGWFADTPSNRKVIVVFLREMYDSETGTWVFTEEAFRCSVVIRLRPCRTDRARQCPLYRGEAIE